MTEPDWLHLDDVLQLHGDAIDAFGGSHGERDRGLLESAIMRAQQVYAYAEQVDLYDLADVYLTALVRSHPFADGNKRVSFAAAILFLELNGSWTGGANAEATQLVYDLIAGRVDEADVAAWFRANSAPT